MILTIGVLLLLLLLLLRSGAGALHPGHQGAHGAVHDRHAAYT
jgi:UPF0716 family protein affecting phage T7 exclusion